MSSRPNHRRLFGDKIRTFRIQAGLTQQELADRAGLHKNFIGQVERGNMEISLTSMLKVANALNVKVRDLVEEL